MIIIVIKVKETIRKASFCFILAASRIKNMNATLNPQIIHAPVDFVIAIIREKTTIYVARKSLASWL